MSIDQGARDLATLAKEQYADYKGRFLPLEHQFALKMSNDIPAKRSQAIAGSMAQVQSSMAAGNEAMMKNGANPNSGRVMGLQSAYAGAMGGAAGMGAVGADDSVAGGRWAGITKAMRQGRGQASQSVAGLTSGVYLAQQAEALKDKTNNAIQASNYNMYGNIAGIAAGAGAHYGGAYFNG